MRAWVCFALLAAVQLLSAGCSDERATVDAEVRRLVTEFCGDRLAVESLELTETNQASGAPPAEGAQISGQKTEWLAVISLKGYAGEVTVTAPVYRDDSGALDYSMVRTVLRQIGSAMIKLRSGN
jgi:hypothetical protein